MNKSYGYLSLMLLLFLAGSVGKAQQLKVEPAMPQRNQPVKIVFMPAKSNGDTSNSIITDRDTGVTMVFTYSNLYDQPWRMPMTKKGDQWEAAFQLPRYATYATFTLESGKKSQKPAKDKHYAIPVYENGKRVKSGYLYESYSLSAQMGKDPRLAEQQGALLNKELELYPDNYEAKVRLLHNKMNKATGEEKEQFRKQALEVIAANFHSDPGNMGLMNKTTMGYLIIGEKTRLDSLYKVVLEKYPNSEAGYEMRIDDIRDLSDSRERKAEAEKLLKEVTPQNAKYVDGAYEVLLNYYAEARDAKNALVQLKKLKEDTSPYRGETLLRRARLLMQNGILLDTAIAYTDRAFAMAQDFPAGIIRFFPETGHILPYATPEAKKQVEQTARGNSLSLMALVQLKKGDKQKGMQTMQRALDYSSDAQTLTNAGMFYRLTGNPEKAYQVTKKLVMNKQEDTAAQRLMKEDYGGWKKSLAGWEQEQKEVTDHWRTEILTVLKKERISKKAPVIERLVDIKGNPVLPETMAGKIVVIDYWATWCLPCMKEMPYLESVYKKYKDDSRVMIMIVNSGSGNTLQDAQGWKGNQTYSFPVYYTNDKALGEKFGFNVIPATYVIDASGNIQFRNIGFEGPVIEHKLSTAIDILLEEKGQARL